MTLAGWILLLVVVAAVGAYAARRRRPKLPAPTVPRVTGDPDDLASLGLSTVRARTADADRPADDGVHFEEVPGRPSEARPVPRPTPPGDEARRADGPRPISRSASPASGVAVAADAPWEGTAAPLLLASLAAHVGGPVAVVRHDGERHRVEARSDGGPLEPIRGRPLGLGGPAELRGEALGGLAALVGGWARAVPLGEHVVLLGSRGEQADRYLDLLAALTPGAELPSHYLDLFDGADTPGAETEPTPDAAPETEPEAAPVPRATIIAEEQDAARADGRPLAFALVTLADAEERLTQHAPEDVARAEADLRERLEAAPDVGRVEPFGALLFGAFLDLGPREAATWCDLLASGDPPLFIGAVAPADGNPTDVRDAAAQALHDAYDQRRTRVVEV